MEPTPLQTFDKNRKCPQDEGTTKNAYHADRRTNGDVEDLLFEPCREYPLPHMHRTCQACGYSWAEAPLV